MKQTRTIYTARYNWKEDESGIAKATGPRMHWIDSAEKFDCWFGCDADFKQWIHLMLVSGNYYTPDRPYTISIWRETNNDQAAQSINFREWFELCEEVRKMKCFDDSPDLRSRFLHLAKAEILLQLGIS